MMRKLFGCEADSNHKCHSPDKDGVSSDADGPRQPPHGAAQGTDTNAVAEAWFLLGRNSLLILDKAAAGENFRSVEP